METKERPWVNDADLPADAMERLVLFAEWTGTTPPRVLDDGCFTDEFLRYADSQGLSLDWFILADERGLVMQVHRAAKGHGNG